MRETTVKLFTFQELSASAKERAKYEYFASIGYCWGDEAMDSIKALAAHFDGTMNNWGIDWANCSHSFAEFRMPEMTEKEIREKLKELGTYNRKTGKGNGDCKLTGYSADEDAIDGFRIAFRNGERDLRELMNEAFYSWLKAGQADFEWQQTEEQFAETCDANDYEFYEDGELS